MPASPNPKGLFCPNCKGVRLAVVSSCRPCANRKVRYRRCGACGLAIKSVEVVVTGHAPRKPPAA